MATRIRSGAIPLGLAVASFVLALLQRPGSSSSDTKIDLHTRPAELLADVAHLWTSTAGLGGVQSAQYSGYLFPMGPYFALTDAIGLSPWLAHRLWLGAILALGCWGMVRLGDVLFERPRGIAQLAAGLLYLLNPYVVVFTNRTSVTLLAYAALPWLVLIAYRGVRDPRRWRMPAALALVVTASGPGVNVAVVAFVLLGPALLLLYEVHARLVPGRDAWAFGWRAALATLAASLWWLAPAAAQARFGIDFLKFTEPAGAIWSTTSLTESLRLMGYWIAYIGVGYGGSVEPYFSNVGTLLFEPLVVIASLAVPGLILWGFAWTRRARYAAFLLALVLLALVMMVVGFPEGTPLRRAATGAYNHLPSIRFLRTTYKAGPLLALGLAGLGGLAAAMAADWLRARARAGTAGIRGRALPAAVAALGLALCLLAAWPLVRGRAVDREVTWERIPAAWTAVAADLERSVPDDRRALVLPGQLYAFYDWGGTVDPILPALTDRPVAIRTVTPYGDLHGTDLLWTTDALVQQDRLVPGQLTPLVRLLSAAALVTGTDDDFRRSGAAPPAAAAATLADQGYGQPEASFGPRRRYEDLSRDGLAAVELPQTRRYTVARSRPLVRLQPDRPAAIVDGSADGIAQLAAFGGLRDGTLEYAGDLDADTIRAAARRGTEIVMTDSNRRRVVVISRMRQNVGAALGPDDPISEDAAVLNPFPERGTDGQTVALLDGARSITAPFSPGYSQMPAHRPFAAFDGDERTFWLADAALQPDRHWVEIEFDRPTDVPYVDVLPRTEAGAEANELIVGERRMRLRKGWNRMRLGLTDAASLKLLVTARETGSAAAGGLAEVRIPGVEVTQALRPPTLAEAALRGRDLARTPLTYVFERTTADRPYEQTSSYGEPIDEKVPDPDQLEALRVERAGDGEHEIARVINPPAARDWTAEAWVDVSPEASPSQLAQLARSVRGDRLETPCGVIVVSAGGERMPMSVTGSARDFDTGAPLRARSCEPVGLPVGAIRLTTRSDTFKVNLLRLRSEAPNPVTAAPPPGRVVDTGAPQRGGGRDGVRVELAGPGTLVLGQSYSSGWRAYCDGRSLGEPRVVDGYANGWTAKPPCSEVRFAFAPDRPVRAIQLASALACLLLLALALRRGNTRQAARVTAADPGAPAHRALPLRQALVTGLVAGAVLGFGFSLRAGLAIFLGVTLIARLGIGTRELAIAAGVLLALVVPALYVLDPAEDRGGYNPGYAGEHVAAHWVGVAAYALLAVALVQTLSRARYRPRPGAGAAAGAGGPRSRP